MSNNKTLDGFISQLMHDDKALNKFLADPTNGGTEHGITKAERAVLRRVTAHLSNKSKNGFGIQRDLSSYRRSLRLLQNVLHKHSAAKSTVVTNEDTDDVFSFQVYITGTPSPDPLTSPSHNPAGAPYDNPALAYTNYVTFTTNVSDATTIGQAMKFNPTQQDQDNETFTVNIGSAKDKDNNQGNLEYTATFRDEAWYVTEFNLTGFSSGIDGKYILPFEFNGVSVKGTDRFPFWFFSLDGQAISPNSNQGYSKTKGVTPGDDGESFVDFPLNESNYIVWQPIAPDMDYGFAPCFFTNKRPVLLGVPIQTRTVTEKGEVFYTNTVENVLILSDAEQILLAQNPDGTGTLRTDDKVSIKFTEAGNPSNTYTYTNSYNLPDCSGLQNTGSVDLKSDLSSLIGKLVTIDVEYSDVCGGQVSSNGYFLVFSL